MRVESRAARGRTTKDERCLTGALLVIAMSGAVACGGRSDLAELLRGRDDSAPMTGGNGPQGVGMNAAAGALSMTPASGGAGQGGTSGIAGSTAAGAPASAGAAGAAGNAEAMGGLGGQGGLAGSAGTSGVAGDGAAGISGSPALLPMCHDVLVFEGRRMIEAAGRPAWGRGGWASVTGDWNGDHQLDLALLSDDVRGVSVFLGNGDGTFRQRVDYQLPYVPNHLVVGDFDGNGSADLAMTGYAESTIALLFGNGDGTFALGPEVEAGAQATTVVVGDWDRDGASDLAIGYVEARLVAVLLSRGDGSFEQTFEERDTLVLSLAAGDLDADGQLDLVMANGSVQVLLGSGDGTFHAGAEYDVHRDGIDKIQVHDFDKDGVLDIAAGPVCPKGGSPDSMVLLGNGDGSFGGPIVSPGWGCTLGVIDDLDNDGYPDVFSSRVLLGKGDGSFAPGPHTAYSLGALGDWDGDGNLDLLAVAAGNMLYTLPGHGDGTFGAARTYPTGSYPSAVLVEDLNRDGAPDLVTANSSNAVSVLLGGGDGSFSRISDTPIAQSPRDILAADLNGDELPDLVTAGSVLAGGRSASMSVLLGTGGGRFGTRLDYEIDEELVGLAAGDMNGDGVRDVVTAHFGSRALSVWIATGDGGFAEPRKVSLSSRPRALALGDLDGDGAVDVAVSTQEPPYFELLFGAGDGSFERRAEVPHVREMVAFRLGDVDGDRDLDIVATPGSTLDDSVQVLLNAGDGTFIVGAEYSVRASFYVPELVDLDGDRDLDIALVGDSPTVLLGAGDGTFTCEQSYTAVNARTFADVNRDTKVDILSLSDGGFVTVFLQPTQ